MESEIVQIIKPFTQVLRLRYNNLSNFLVWNLFKNLLFLNWLTNAVKYEKVWRLNRLFIFQESLIQQELLNLLQSWIFKINLKF